MDTPPPSSPRAAIEALRREATTDMTAADRAIVEAHNDAIAAAIAVIDAHDAKIEAGTQAAIDALRAEGRKLGGRPPYGYEADEDGKLCEVAAEQRVIAKAKELRDQGFAYRKIAEKLEVRGMRNRERRRFGPTEVKRMIDPDYRAKISSAAAPSSDPRA